MTEIILRYLPGLAQMPNVHPLLVQFPIALLTGFFLVELLGVILKAQGMRTAASGMLYLGTLGAMFTVAAGFDAARTVPHGAEVHAILERHEEFGVAVLSMSLLLSIWRLIARARFSRLGQFLHLVVALVMVVTLARGADLGGMMVYRYGVAVKAGPAVAGNVTQAQAHAHDPHEDGILHRIQDWLARLFGGGHPPIRPHTH